MEPTLKVGSKRPATDSSFDERMCINCQTYVRGKKLSSLGEEGCDKLLQAASKRGLKTTDLVTQVSPLHSTLLR